MDCKMAVNVVESSVVGGEKLRVIIVNILLLTFLPTAVSLTKCEMIDSCRASTDKGEINLWPLAGTGGQPR
jgi:hypothetical protein